VANLGLGAARSRTGRWLLQATRLVVEAEQPVHLQVDGDYRGQATRFEIGIADEAVQLCFPAP
jgi:diacylglycerol kinase family enzyme